MACYANTVGPTRIPHAMPLLSRSNENWAFPEAPLVNSQLVASMPTFAASGQIPVKPEPCSTT